MNRQGVEIGGFHGVEEEHGLTIVSGRGTTHEKEHF